MKKTKILIRNISMLLFIGIAIFTLSFSPAYYSQYKPIMMKRSELEKAVKLQEPRAIINSGKIYLKDNHIYISEKHKGIHIIDNTDPTNPENIGFIQIDGCIDMAMKGSILYADNAVDLIAIQINSTATEIKLTKRIKNVFPEFTTPDHMQLAPSIYRNTSDDMVIVDWELITD